MKSFTGYLICIILWCWLLLLFISSFSCFWNNPTPLLVMHVLTYFMGWDLRCGQISRRTIMRKPTTKTAKQKKSHGSSLSVMDCITCFQSFLLQGERRKNKHPTHFLDNMSVTNPYWLIHAGVLGDHRSLLGRERM